MSIDHSNTQTMGLNIGLIDNHGNVPPQALQYYNKHTTHTL